MGLSYLVCFFSCVEIYFMCCIDFFSVLVYEKINFLGVKICSFFQKATLDVLKNAIWWLIERVDFLSIYDINISGLTGFHDCFFTLSLYVFEMIAFPSVFCVKEMSLIQIRDIRII